MNNLPIYINNRNRLSSLSTLIAWLRAAGHSNITVIDNASTYEPLLEFYETSEVKVKRLSKNLGPYALWNPECADLRRADPFVYTDSDIVPDDACPRDAIRIMHDQMLSLQGRFKVGFGLRIDDIPDHYAQANRVRMWEARFWEKQSTRPCKAPLYIAKIDTTFAVYPSRSGFFANALRTGAPYLARHTPWYVDSANPSEEDQFVESNADKRFVSWGISECHSKRVAMEEKNVKLPARKEKHEFNPRQPDWEKLPMHTDMSCYAPWYQNVIRRVVAKTGGSPLVVEAGTRFGCSARIMADALKDSKGWKLHLVDPVPTAEARQVVNRNPGHVTFMKMTGERAAAKFSPRTVDFLHIDADTDGTHPYDMALDILLAFWQRLKPDAYVAFHDCTDHFPGIRKLVDQLVLSGQWEVEYAEPQQQCLISAPALAKRVDLEPLQSSLSVVVPIIKDRWLRGLLQCLSKQTVLPNEILVIDNSGTNVGEKTCKTFSDLPIRYLPQSQNLGVNGSWNLGVIECQTDFVSILNDDILIPDEFVESMLQVFNEYRNVGLVVPQTIASRSGVKYEDSHLVAKRLPQREGWAFTVRRDAWEEIPHQFFTFCGDDFVYKSIKAKGMWCVSNANVQIWHAVGISTDKAERKRLNLPVYECERDAWHEYCMERGW